LRTPSQGSGPCRVFSASAPLRTYTLRTSPSVAAKAAQVTTRQQLYQARASTTSLPARTSCSYISPLTETTHTNSNKPSPPFSNDDSLATTQAHNTSLSAHSVATFLSTVHTQPQPRTPRSHSRARSARRAPLTRVKALVRAMDLPRTLKGIPLPRAHSQGALARPPSPQRQGIS
jgi:hypothetical protein